MAKKLITFFMLVSLLLLSSGEAPPVISTTTKQQSNPQDESSINDNDGCAGLGSEDCLIIRRFLADHTDYIYTQDITAP
ncbi:conserved hypothetical protein [Ricinus communis]|uniref:Phytosulfokine n=1 Tax=Ricinus communis TaxID=3988 RepID=B9RLD2_RICCO|nr:conserved hypothetical protein [Ricinus communis]